MPTNETYMVIQCNKHDMGNTMTQKRKKSAVNFLRKSCFSKISMLNFENRDGNRLLQTPECQNQEYSYSDNIMSTMLQKQHKLLRKWLLSEINVISIPQIGYFEISHPMIGLKA